MMKTRFTFTLLLMSLCLTVFSQNIPVYPIPSYNITVESVARFIPTGTRNLTSLHQDREKRTQHITVRGSVGSYATVWVYSLDGLDTLGPYTVYAGETLDVEIDEREWGVLVQTTYEIQVDVWITGE